MLTGDAKSKKNFLMIVVGSALVTVLIVALLINIFERKQEGKNPYLKIVEVTEDTTDPAIWGSNWPQQFDTYKRTVDATRTQFGGSDALPAQKSEKDPWLTRLFAGYAFSIDYRDRRGHYYMLSDQEQTKRVTQKPQPGACLHCHASIIPAYRSVGMDSGAKPQDAVMAGFEIVNAMKYKEAHDLVNKEGKKLISHPISCVDCHDPKNMELRVTRPGFINGIRVLKEAQGVKNYDVNKMASRQEMRSFVCAQCHVEYYFKGDKKLLTYPWHKGNKVEDIEKYYDEVGFSDWKHAETGAPVLKAQHPEFEMWSQGVHARSGVACADCHMPYVRVGASKVSDHWVRSPLLNINNACQTCHHFPEGEMQARVDLIQQRNYNLMKRSGEALISYLDVMKRVRAPVDQKAEAQIAAQVKSENLSAEESKKRHKELTDKNWSDFVATDANLKKAWELQRKAQFRLDFVAAENSMGFHAPQEAARILGESIDYFRQAEIAARAAEAKR